jgi:hypothetical protein
MSTNRSNLEDLVDNLELAFKSFVASYSTEVIDNRTNHELQKKLASIQAEGNRLNLETQTSELIDKARALEIQIVKSRLELIRSTPDLLLQEDIQSLNSELTRKNHLLNHTKEKLFNYEQSLKRVSMDIDNNFKNRIESCAQVLNAYDQQQQQLLYQQQFNPSSVRSDHAASVQAANQSFEQPGSHENSIIVLDSNKNYN